MRNLLALSAALVLAFAGIGWYRGWYKVETEPATGGHQTVNHAKEEYAKFVDSRDSRSGLFLKCRTL